MIPQTTFVLTFRPHIISELGGVIWFDLVLVEYSKILTFKVIFLSQKSA